MHKLLTLAALAASTLAWGAITVPAASAVTVTVTLSGSQPGRVVSTYPGIDCSNIPGQEKTDCSFESPGTYSPLELTATAGPDSAFQGWSSAFAGGTCASGITNPCLTGLQVWWWAPVTVDAKFGTKPTAPSVISGEAPELTFPSAKLHGEVNPNSDAYAVADCRFEYGETTAYGRFRPCQPRVGSGTSAVPVSATIGVLEPDTTYHYRLVATNGGGRTEGEDQTLRTAPAPADSCPNAKARAQQGAVARVLPDCMAYELVTPPFTAGARAGVSDIRDDGNATIFNTAGGIADTPSLPDTGVTYRADRTDKGWAASATAPPAADYPYIGSTGRIDTSKDLRTSLWQANLKADEGTNRWTTILGEAAGPFVQAGPTLPQGGAYHPAVVGTSSDLGTVVLSTDQPRNGQNDGTVDSRMLRAGLGTLLLSTRNADGTVRVRQLAYRAGATMFPDCDVVLGGKGTARASVSADGDKVFFTTGVENSCDVRPDAHRVWAKVGNADPIDLSASRCDDGDCGVAEAADFLGASRDGSRIYFRSEEKLVNGDVKSDEGASTADNDLYEYNFGATGEKLRSVTASLDADGADLVSVVRVSDDGSYVYFVAKGRALAGANARGLEPQPGQPNLYVYRRAAGQATGSTAFIGALDGADLDLLYPTYGRHSAGTSSSGRFLVFLSAANLTGDKQAGDAFRDLYRYDSQTDELRRIWSKDAAHNGTNRIGALNDSWAPPEGQGSQGGYQLAWNGQRTVSDDGATIAFDTTEPLSPWDGNREPDVYMWKAGTGRFTLLTEGRPTRPGAISASASYVGMSPSGDSLFFTTDTPVVKAHTSTQVATFVARRGGGFLDDPVTPVCDADACQGPGPAAPGAPAIETGKDTGPGTVTPAEPPVGKVSVAGPKSVRGTQTTLKVKVSAKGYLTTTGSAVRVGTRSVKQAGTYAVAVRLTASAAKTLARKKRVKAKVKVTFRPEGGADVSRTVTLTFKQAAAKKRAATAKTSLVAKGGR